MKIPGQLSVQINTLLFTWMMMSSIVVVSIVTRYRAPGNSRAFHYSLSWFGLGGPEPLSSTRYQRGDR